MFGEKVRKLREDLGWTQQKLADELGCSLRTISAYERENIRPRHRKTYNKLAEIFGVDVNYLLTDEDSFVLRATEEFGAQGRQEANALIRGVIGLFAGGAMSLTDKKAALDAIEEAYYIAKREEELKKDDN